jgi:hypothetical protein
MSAIASPWSSSRSALGASSDPVNMRGACQQVTSQPSPASISTTWNVSDPALLRLSSLFVGTAAAAETARTSP